MEKKLDLRLQKTFLALHGAFTELLEEKRFDELTVNELCERAMIRRTTFYKHFADKYDYFAFYIKEMVSSFQSELPSDAMDEKPNSYFLNMCRKQLMFLHKHERIVSNLKNSRMFPLLLHILLEQFTEDIMVTLNRIAPALAENPEKQKGIAAFYAGGMVSCHFQLTQEGSPVDDAVFLDIIDKMTEKVVY